jgi:hypothetical protein
MQKWRKYLLIYIFIMSIIGGLIGFAMGKSGLGKVKFFPNIDFFTLFMLIILIIMIVCLIVDIIKIYTSKKQFGSEKFKITIHTRNRLRNVLIFLVVDTIFIFGIVLCSDDIHMLPLGFMILILTSIQGSHYRIPDGISENGILYYGVYFSWNKVKDYEITGETLIEMNIVDKALGLIKYNNKIKFHFDKKDKNNIEKFLVAML